MFAWWVVAATLVIEFLFVRAAFRLNAANAALATFGANAVSAIVGLLALPYLGIVVEIGIIQSGLGEKVEWDTFGLPAWVLAAVLAAALNVAVEIPVYRFGYGLRIDSRAFWLIALANFITAGLALASLAVVAHEYY